MLNSDFVSKAFGKQSSHFDELYDTNTIVRYMRKNIREVVLEKVTPGDHLLELNAGTGTDAIYFGKKGIKVSASDISPEMVKMANEKIIKYGLSERVTFSQMSYEELESIPGQYDHVYSNFGGLNCTENITDVIKSILKKLKSGKSATLVILPPFTLWEKLYVFTGNFKVANRRKHLKPSKAQIEGQSFNCWYFNPEDIIKPIQSEISSFRVKGLCIMVPPSFKSTFAGNHPVLFRVLMYLDGLINSLPVVNRIGDYYVLSITKK